MIQLLASFLAELKKYGPFAIALGMLVGAMIYEGDERANMLTQENTDLKDQRAALMVLVQQNTTAMSNLNQSVAELRVIIGSRR